LGIRLPEPIRGLLREGDGRYAEDGRWWVVWPLDRIVEENLAAWEHRGLPRHLLAVGDDGTGDPFCVRVPEGDDHVVRWSWIDSDVTVSEGSWADFCRVWLELQ
jgi:hypothetical protein